MRAACADALRAFGRWVDFDAGIDEAPAFFYTEHRAEAATASAGE